MYKCLCCSELWKNNESANSFFFQRLEYIIVSSITGVVEHADFRETEGGSKLGGLGGRILGAPLKLLSTDTFKSAASGNAGFFLPSHVKAPWKQSK